MEPSQVRRAVEAARSTACELGLQVNDAVVIHNSDRIAVRLIPCDVLFATTFASVYPLYVQKAERKNRTKEEIDHIICWLTGYSQAGLEKQINQQSDFETFFAQAPAVHPNTSLIKGVVCGVRVEEVEDPLMRRIRYLDKLIDELAKGKAMEKILRQ